MENLIIELRKPLPIETATKATINQVQSATDHSTKAEHAMLAVAKRSVTMAYSRNSFVDANYALENSTTFWRAKLITYFKGAGLTLVETRGVMPRIHSVADKGKQKDVFKAIESKTFGLVKSANADELAEQEKTNAVKRAKAETEYFNDSVETRTINTLMNAFKHAQKKDADLANELNNLIIQYKKLNAKVA